MSNDRYYNWITNASLDEIDLDALPQFDERNAAREFDGMTNDEIKQLYISEAIDAHHDQEHADLCDEMNQQDDD